LVPIGTMPIRVLVIYDRSPNGVAPLITDILAFDNFVSPMNLNTSDRFLVISDKTFVEGINGGTTNLAAKEYKKMALDTLCLGAAGAIADISQGALFIMLAQGSLAAPIGTFSGHFRLRFKDA